MSNKLSLKWTDFKSTVSNSFGVLREEKEFFDVTLVSDDERQIPAHKLVLSACSDFFKSILRNNSHSHPLLYLSGIHSTNLSLILDYIYQGEVQIYQEHLDSFLEVAQKLKIEGLITGAEENISQNRHIKSEETLDESLMNREEDVYISDGETDTTEETVGLKKHKLENTIAASVTDNSMVEEKIQEMMVRQDGLYHCNVCGYKNKRKPDITRHIETHIEGLSYPCNYCQKTFRSTNSLNTHISIYHTLVGLGIIIIVTLYVLYK